LAIKTYLPILAAVAGFFLLTGLCMAITTVYTYKCPKCGLILTYDRAMPGVKCPNDGWIMDPK